MQYQLSDRILGVKPSAIREILKMSSDPSVIAFSAGNPAPEALPVDTVKEIIDDIFAKNPIQALQYSVTEGYQPLRQELERLCAKRYGIFMEENRVIVVSGAQQGIELACKILCNEGDTVLCEDPSFIGSLNSFRSYGVNLRGVELEEDGIHLGKLEEVLSSDPKAKLLYLIPNFQNPSGGTMSWEKRKAVYQLACRWNVIILEDDPYGELRFSGEVIPSIKSMDKEGRVIYVGSFSKILSPGLRVGYAVMNQGLAEKFTVAKQCSDVHTAILNQVICHKFLAEYDLEAHLAGLRQLYKEKCGLMLSQIQEHFSSRISYTVPEGGLFLWCRLPEGVDMLDFCTQAVERCRVAVVPGTAFNCDEQASSPCFRMNFSSPTNEMIVEGCRRLGALTRELLGD